MNNLFVVPLSHKWHKFLILSLLIPFSTQVSAQALIDVVNVSASSELRKSILAVDGNLDTRWESLHQIDSSQLIINLGARYELSNTVIHWEAANAKDYIVQGSNDQRDWTTLASVSNAVFGSRTDQLTISGDYQYVRINASQRSAGNQWGFSIWEIELYGEESTDIKEIVTPTPAPTPDPVEEPTRIPDATAPTAELKDLQLSYSNLFNQTFTPAQSQNWRTEPNGAIVTSGSGRGRLRHESENSFYAFPPHYFEHRTFGFEIHDNVANGATQIAIYYEPEFAHYRAPECRSAYKNVWRADFNNNSKFEETKRAEPDANGRGEKWVCYITRDAHEGDDGRLEVGEWMEVEFQQFLGRFQGDPEVQGQTVYYTDTYRFKIGEPGIYIVGDDKLEQQIRTGGNATAPFVNAGGVVSRGSVIASTPPTLTYRDSSGNVITKPVLDNTHVYSTYVVDDEAALETSFFREALNIRWDTHNSFLNGRRIFHTRFDTGAHTEPGSPVFEELSGLASDLLVNRSCVDCHQNNGRGPSFSDPASTQTRSVKLSSGRLDSRNQPEPHAYFGSLLHSRSLDANITAEGSLNVSYSVTNGTFSDGRTFELSGPDYSVQTTDEKGGSALYFSPRMPQTITGLGLLEALDDDDIADQHDPHDTDGNGISGRISLVMDPESQQQKIGRFGWKATHASLTSFTAEALNQDIGVNTSLITGANCGADQISCAAGSAQHVELADDKLNELVVYLQALGAPSRRPDEVSSDSVRAGEAIFNDLKCGACHTPSMQTGYRHPLAELRGQTIRAYTDLLLHDMGEALADNLTASAEYNREWRTPPLWGLGLIQSVNGHTRLLHDGRARNIEEAILWHGGEALNSTQTYRQLSLAQRQQLLDFLNSL